jgi:factor associated with neutral sphingomyelinase activation
MNSNTTVDRNEKNSKANFVYGSNKFLTERILSSLQPPRGYCCSPNVAGQDRSRFSNLLLEYGERQLHDWAVVASSSSALYHNSSSSSYHHKAKSSPGRGNYPNDNGHIVHQPTATENPLQSTSYSTMRKIDGRLRLCSISLVFEPNDWSRGIIRCPLKYLDAPPSLSEELDSVVVKCSRHFIMKTGNIIAPYDTIEKSAVFRFTFLHSSPQQFLQVATLLFNNGQISSTLTDQIIPFDASNFIDVREKALTTNLRCSKITPLLSTPGCLVVTSSYIYFQPCASGIISAHNTTTTIAPKATPWALTSITGYGRRYSGLKDSALELFFISDHNSPTSVLLAFETPEDRERVLRFLPTNVPCHTDREFVVACCNQWVNDATLSNYDYLLALNSAAARSFHDLSRYPVFPWVIKDYKSSKLDLTESSTFRDLSKPVGALDENRLEYFQTRFESMQQDMTHPFLYGTHYSAPGYVLYYLVRSMPEHMLCLQNGKDIFASL